MASLDLPALNLLIARSPRRPRLFHVKKGVKKDITVGAVFHGRLRTSLPRVNFTNILRAAFMLADPKSAKKLFDLTVFFVLLMLMKLTPRVGESKRNVPFVSLLIIQCVSGS